MKHFSRRDFLKLTGSTILGMATYNLINPNTSFAADLLNKSIPLNAKELIYSGRIDFSNKLKPNFIFPASSLNFRFFGKSAKISLVNEKAYNNNYVGAIVDGIQQKYLLNDSGITEINLFNEETPREHNVLFFKRMDGGQHEFNLESLSISNDGYLLEPLPRPTRRIEVYGDSVSAGEVTEAIDFVGKSDPQNKGEYSNSYYSYAWMTARNLNAEIHNISQGGIALLNGTGWFAAPKYPGMESMWDKLYYNPYLNNGKQENWDFTKYTPHLVIVAIGQNDNRYNGEQNEYMTNEPNGKKALYWKKKYKEFINNLRKKYPKAVIILTTTILNHYPSWDNAIDEVCKDINDSRIVHFLYTRNGKGTPGHPRIPEDKEMADELTSYINELDKKINIWE